MALVGLVWMLPLSVVPSPEKLGVLVASRVALGWRGPGVALAGRLPNEHLATGGPDTSAGGGTRLVLPRDRAGPPTLARVRWSGSSAPRSRLLWADGRPDRHPHVICMERAAMTKGDRLLGPGVERAAAAKKWSYLRPSVAVLAAMPRGSTVADAMEGGPAGLPPVDTEVRPRGPAVSKGSASMGLVWARLV